MRAKFINEAKSLTFNSAQEAEAYVRKKWNNSEKNVHPEDSMSFTEYISNNSDWLLRGTGWVWDDDYYIFKRDNRNIRTRLSEDVDYEDFDLDDEEMRKSKSKKYNKPSLRFSDGEEFDTSGPWRAEKRSDGWYVLGHDTMAPADSYEEAIDMIDRLEG